MSPYEGNDKINWNWLDCALMKNEKGNTLDKIRFSSHLCAVVDRLVYKSD
jgi:hypothetical protein